MDKDYQVAQYIIHSYENITSSKFEDSELVLHKLMYFSQKMSLAFTGETIIEGDFEGWVHGPVHVDSRGYFDYYKPFDEEKNDLTEVEKYIIDNVIYEYGKYAPWRLRDLSHEETAWIKSRKGLKPTEYGREVIRIEDISKDSEEIRLYDHEYDMYVDEFDDYIDEYEFA